MATPILEQVHQVVAQTRTTGPYQEKQQAHVTVKIVLQEAQVPEAVVATMELGPQTLTRIVKKTISIMDLHHLATMMANTRLPLPLPLPLLRFLSTLLPTAIPSRMVSPTALLRRDQMLLMGITRLMIPIKAIQDNRNLNPLLHLLLLLLLLLQTRMEATGRQIKMELASREKIAMRMLLMDLMLTLLAIMLLQPLLQILAAQWTALSISTIQHAPTRTSYLLDLQHPNLQHPNLQHLNRRHPNQHRSLNRLNLQQLNQNHSLQRLKYQRQHRIPPLLKAPLPALLLLLLEIILPVVLKAVYQTALTLISLQRAMAAVERRAQTLTRTLAVALLSLLCLRRLLRQHPPLFQIIAPATKTHLVTMEMTARLIQDLAVCLQTLRRRIVLMCLLPM